MKLVVMYESGEMTNHVRLAYLFILKFHIPTYLSGIPKPSVCGQNVKTI